MSAGILSENQVKELIEAPGKTTRLYQNSSGGRFDGSLIKASAIDLPLGENYWEMKGSCRTGQKFKVLDITRRHCTHPSEPKKLSSEESTVLKGCRVYLFEVDCRLDLKGVRIQGKATGRSSIGRLDVLVRLLVNGSDTFDSLACDREHQLYVEVTPISFDLEVKKGTALSQLRLYKGKEDDISLTKEELYHEEDNEFPVIEEDGKPQRQSCDEDSEKILFPFRLDLTPDPVSGCSAFRAKKNSGLPPIDPEKNSFYDPTEYWEPIEAKDGAIHLEPGRLHILRSKERLRMPGHLALECQSYTTQMGEWRIEYAGFAHPYFGSQRKDGKNGTPIIFEVRGHNVPTILTDGIPLGNVRFLRMSKPAEKPLTPQKYDNQELKLSSCFKPWPKS
ncbi:MAG TPA: hypothetical protein DCX07_01155 [Phycisphaerales bacterium]|nr:hypothetical protein [Phycisphaerales bacterium]